MLSCIGLHLSCWGDQVLKENQPRMWDVREYELVVVPGRPTRVRRVSVGRPGTTSEY